VFQQNPTGVAQEDDDLNFDMGMGDFIDNDQHEMDDLLGQEDFEATREGIFDVKVGFLTLSLFQTFLLIISQWQSAT
jgi:hypothetical protein